MTESYAFFGGTPEDPRQYNQTEFAEVLERFFRNGYFPGVGMEVAVFPTDPARLAVRVGTGQAWINGYWYKNDTWKEIDLAPADGTNARIDRIVLRLDTVNARNIEAVVKTGIPAANPTAPNLERTEQIYELSLATVRVNSGATSITASNITDTRDDEIVCGRAVPWNVPTDEDLYQHVSDNVRHITASERSSWNAKETPAGAQAKADAAEQAAKAYTDAEVGTRATKTEFNAHVNDNTRHITASERSSWNAKETPAGAQAKADAAEQAAIEWAQSFGLGSNRGQPIDDLNNATQNGWYVAGSSTANTPDGLSWWVVEVSCRETERLVQKAYRTISNNRQVKIRFLTDNGWSEWGDIWTSFNLSSPARTNVDNDFTSAQRIQNLLRFAATSESGIIQAGENSSDTNARLRIARSNTTSTPIALMEIFSEEVKINGNDVWHTGNQGNPNNLNTSSKQIVGAINELFSTVSDGKQAIRDAIADAGGTPPSGSPNQYTHQDLANAIDTVSKYASGSEPTDNTTSMTIQVRGINFDVDVFTFFYQTNDDGGVGVIFTNPYSPFIRKTNTIAGDPSITPVTGGFDITISRPADTGFDWEAWGGRP